MTSIDLDPELAAVERELLDLGLDRVGEVLRDTIDQLLDGQRTGRFDWASLSKTEKTHMGSIVEINLQREFEFTDGTDLDFQIAGTDVDCKFSIEEFGWMIPPEAFGKICLLVWADDVHSLYSMGLLRITPGLLRRPNRDAKSSLLAEARERITWLRRRVPLPENLLLALSPAVRERILDNALSGQRRVDMLFRTVQRRLVRRSVVVTVGQQADSLKRVRDARLHLRSEGILILGHQEDDPLIAAGLGVPVPSKGEFVSVAVEPVTAAGGGVEIEGSLWAVAVDGHPVVPAPRVQRARRSNGDNE